MTSTPRQVTAETSAAEGTAAEVADATDEKSLHDEKHGSSHAPLQTGGAKTFVEFEEFAAARDIEVAVDDEVEVFNALIDNIRFDFEMSATEKAIAIEALAAALPARIDDARITGTIPEHLHVGGSTGGAVESTVGSAKDADEPGEKATKTVEGVALRRSDFADHGTPDSTGTWKLPLTKSAGGAPNADRIADAITALQPGGFRGQTVRLTNPRATVIGRISRAIGRLGNKAARERLRSRVKTLRGSREIVEGELVDKAVTNDPGSVAVFKDHDDKWRWVAVHSNRYKDREHEIFTADSHKAWADSVWETGIFPTLRLWHIPTDFGRADWVDYDEKGFVVSSGTFNEGAEDIAEALSRRKDIGCSHGFRFDPSDLDEEGTYHRYRTFEISVLPTRSAANQLTAFSAGKEIPTMDDERKAFLLEVAGPERVEQLEGALDDMKAYAEEKGLSFKDIADAAFPDLQGVKDVGDGDAVADAETPAETPAATPAAATPAETPSAEAAPSDEGTAEDHDPASPAETPSAEDAAEAEKTFDAATAQAGPVNPLVAMATALAPAMREAAAEAIEASNGPIMERLDAFGAEIEGLKALTPIVEGLTMDQDELVAAAIRPKSMPRTAGFAASESDETAIDAEALAAVAAQKAGAAGDGTEGMTEAQRAAKGYVDDALGLMAQVPGVQTLAPPPPPAADAAG